MKVTFRVFHFISKDQRQHCHQAAVPWSWWQFWI